MEVNTLNEALLALGELLSRRGRPVELVVIGGGALLLEGVISRPTKDIDAVARIESGALVSSDPLPDFLQEAVTDVGRAYNLDPKWLNGGPASLLELGLPEGLLQRTRVLTFGSLTLHIAHRLDQIHFKLYAAIDSGGPDSKHFQDLLALKPTPDELQKALEWCRTHDVSDTFATLATQTMAALWEALNA